MTCSLFKKKTMYGIPHQTILIFTLYTVTIVGIPLVVMFFVFFMRSVAVMRVMFIGVARIAM